MTASSVSHGDAPSTKTTVAEQGELVPNSDDSIADEIETLGIEKNCDDENEAVKLDEEGLSLEYDVAICGTGLVQSILASALARAGKSVLHCDGADYYGELDAVWNLQIIEEILQRKNSENNEDDIAATNNADSDTIALAPTGGCTSLRWHHSYCSAPLSTKSGKFRFGIEIGTHVKTQFGNGIVRSIQYHPRNCIEHQEMPTLIALEVELHKWNMADGRSPSMHINLNTSEFLKGDTNDKHIDLDATLLEDILCTSKNIRSLKSIHAETILKQSARILALDATPSFVLAAGRAVQGMLASGVADYLEFKPVDGLYWLDIRKPTGNKIGRSKDMENNDTVVLSRVPCSKNDVFGTKLLAPMEKRRFMKFIQLSMDYATEMSVAEEIQQDHNDGGNFGVDSNLESQEEVQSLNERHLNQGRSLARPQNKAVDTSELQVLKECIRDESMTFDDFLKQKYKLSPKLRLIIRYALAWETDVTSVTLAKGMETLRKHLQALGRYGTTAFLVPMYGSGELSQSFCRSAAVFGATYLLRRAPLGIKVESFEGSDETDNICEVPKRCKQRVRGIVLSNDNKDDGCTERGLREQLPRNKTKVIKCSQVIVPSNAIDTKAFSSNNCSENGVKRRIIRRISVFSGTIIQSQSEEQRHVVFIPPQSIGNSHAIHGVLLDSSVSIAPRGCTVLHLTTTVKEDDVGEKNLEGKNINASEILKRAQEAILEPKQTTLGSDDLLTEIYHVTFSHECPNLDDTKSKYYPAGLHLCSHTEQGLTADTAFEQAEKIFSSICPDDKFLGLSSGIDKAIRERAEEKNYDDNDKDVLESALGMIEHASDSS